MVAPASSVRNRREASVVGVDAEVARSTNRAATPGYPGLQSRRRGTAAFLQLRQILTRFSEEHPATTRGFRTEAIRCRLLRMRVPVRGQRRKLDRSTVAIGSPSREEHDRARIRDKSSLLLRRRQRAQQMCGQSRAQNGVVGGEVGRREVARRTRP
jgi:hypothetical protein